MSQSPLDFKNNSTAQRTAPRACYIHVPFCRHRCGYCNFTLIAGRDDLIAAYLEAIKEEIFLQDRVHEIDSLFLGGGTPTHLSAAQLSELLLTIRSRFSLADGGEFSVEANPADVEPSLVQVLADNGATRISLGAQSFERRKLKLLERDHSARDIARAVQMLRNRFRSISLDLIFSVPGESANTWLTDLDHAVRLAPQHISTYGLTFEKGTSFWSKMSKGTLSEIDEELQREMYLAAIDRLRAAGFQHYEVSNFAQPGHACRHNEVYWKGEPFFGFGPGAARFVDGVREVNHGSTTTYIKRLLDGQSPVAHRERLGPEAAARERLVFALRRLDGVNRSWFYEKTGCQIEQLVGDSLSKLVQLKLIDDDGMQIKLTRQGLLLSDSVSVELSG